MSRPAGTCLLSSLVEGLAVVDASADRHIGGLAADSRQVVSGDLFFACAGGRDHGAAFIGQALAAGAAAVLYETVGLVDGMLPEAPDVPLIGVAGLQQQVGIIADRFYGSPSQAQLLIGITGTNGKTSCSHYLAQALAAAQPPCGLVGTLGYGLYGELRSGRHTTPDALTLHALLAEMRASGVRQVVAEVSSHALAQGRVAGVAFDGAIFTNLSHDHLDYHGDFDCYGRVKRSLFKVAGLRYAVINVGDDCGRTLQAELPAGLEVAGYRLFGHQDADALATAASSSPHHYVFGQWRHTDSLGLEIRIHSSWGEGVMQSGLLGAFNAENLLAVLAMLLLMGWSLEQALERLALSRPVSGRMEYYGGEHGQPLVVIDYAHTPDALQQALQTLRAVCRGRLWCVFGCGGDRDRGKRPMMGAIAEQFADRVILTDDNPRSEDAETIRTQIRAGMRCPECVEIKPQRATAINSAIRQASAGDVVLIAGKGHENYQLIGGRQLYFSDREQVQQALKEVA